MLKLNYIIYVKVHTSHSREISKRDYEIVVKARSSSLTDIIKKERSEACVEDDWNFNRKLVKFKMFHCESVVTNFFILRPLVSGTEIEHDSCENFHITQ